MPLPRIYMYGMGDNILHFFEDKTKVFVGKARGSQEGKFLQDLGELEV